MKKVLLSLFILFAASAFAQVNVTFKVDMRGLKQSYTSVQLNGTFNAWCGACNPMTDANNDSIWELTIPLTPGTIEYKFTTDNWARQENFTSGMPCTVTNNGFTNRVLTFTSTTVLPVVCWNKCGICTNSGPQKQQIKLPIMWQDTATVNFTTTDFGGTVSSLAPDPTNASRLALKIIKLNPSETWAGTTLGTPDGFVDKIPFSATSNIMQAKVYSPAVGTVYRLKAEDKNDPTKSVETPATSTVANAWEILTFNFANQAQGTAAINYATSYNKLSIFPNFGTSGAAAGEKTFYIGEVAFGNVTSVAKEAQEVRAFVLPNPNKGQFSIQTQDFAGQNVELKVSDLSGKLMYHELIANAGNTSNISIKDIKPGIYMISAGSKTKLLTYRLIITD